MPEEIHAVFLQYVRKVSGLRAPGVKDAAAFERAVAEIAKATAKLLEALPPGKSPPRTREGEREKAKAKWSARVTRMQIR